MTSNVYMCITCSMFISCNWLFAEEEIDGKLLVQLVEEGRAEDLQQLGLKRLKDQLIFRKILPRATAGAQVTTSCTSQTVDRKQTSGEIQTLTTEEKHVYLIKWETRTT